MTNTSIMPLDCDGFADSLADYLEGDAPEGVRVGVEAHAASCAACQQLLSDLTAVRTDAATLPVLTPARDLWSGIAERIDARVIPMDAPRIARDIPRRRLWLRPAAAAAALVIATATITYQVTRVLPTPAGTVATTVASTTPSAPAEPTAEIISTVTESPTPPRLSARTATPVVAQLASAEPAMGAAEPVFASEISKLRRIVRERRSQLDPKTVAVLAQSIAVSDSALAQSRAALLKDPASGFLASQLNHSLETKVELLRTAALLPSRT